MDRMILGIFGAGVLAILYAIITVQQVMKADAGNKKMQEIAAAIAEGAQAYLKRQYFYIAIVGATLVGLRLVFVGVDLVAALYYSAVINGVGAVPLLVIIFLIGLISEQITALTYRRDT